MRSGTVAKLYIDDQPVGTVRVQGREDSWSHGEFIPSEGFAQFAPLFGRWSLLMHGDSEFDRLGPAASDELRKLEYEIDRRQVKLFDPRSQEWIKCAQVNIDGQLIEWKCY